MERAPNRRKLYLAFIALALIAGPVDQSVSSSFLVGSPLPAFHSLAIAAGAAAIVLAMAAAIRRQRFPKGTEWTALLPLILPQWCLVPIGPNTASLPLLHLGWGTALLLSLAAPIWLGLLSATGPLELEVPRTTVAAAIIGIGAICLSLPLDVTAVGWRQLPALLLNVLLGIAIVASWCYARPRLSACPVLSAAAAYLALSCVGYLAFAGAYERGVSHAPGWNLSWATLIPEVVTLAVSWALWFWLLKHLSLAAFSMRMLANCAATLLPGFLFFGLAQWRIDAAFVIACVAVAIALRATPAREQPVLLGLADS